MSRVFSRFLIGVAHVAFRCFQYDRRDRCVSRPSHRQTNEGGCAAIELSACAGQGHGVSATGSVAAVPAVPVASRFFLFFMLRNKLYTSHVLTF